MATKKRALRLTRISIAEIAGLNAEDIRELQELGIGSLQGLMEAMDDNDGDLTELSTDAVVISREQSARIGDAVLAHPETPKAFKDNYEAHTPPAVPVTPTPDPAPAQPGAIRRFFQGLNPFS